MTTTRSVGDWLGDRFEIVDVIAGGMGIVYMVVDRQNGGIYGLKTLRPEYITDRERKSRFMTEARLWVGLEPHPNIVTAEAIDTFDGSPYLRLEWIKGGHLGHWIGTPRLTLGLILRLAVQFCLGMEHAERGGVRSHRDVKPANLLMTTDGTLKITDFGLARLRDDFTAEDLALRDDPIELDDVIELRRITWTDPPDNRDRLPGPRPGEAAGDPARQHPRKLLPGSPEPDPLEVHSQAIDPNVTADWQPSPLTSEGPADRTRGNAVVGTVLYMAPEQFVDPTRVDARTDLYAFGLVLYEMLTGQRPYSSYSFKRVKFFRLNGTPRPPSTLFPWRWRKYASAIDAVVMKCLKFDQDERYSSPRGLRKDLQTILGRVEPGWRP